MLVLSCFMNMNNRKNVFFIFIFSIFLVCLFFSPVFLKGKVPFPSNLLVSTYSPWKYVPDPDYPNGPSNKPIGFDNIRQFYPNRKFTKEELAAGRFPLWNPYIFSGTPFFSAIDTGVLYPFSIVFQLIPLLDAWSFMVMIQPLLSIWFMFLFLKSLQRSTIVSLLIAFAYAFSGWMIVYWEESLILEHSFLWLPLALYASNCIWDTKRMRGFLLLIFSLASSVFSGFFQMSVYIYLTVFVWNMYRFFSKRYADNFREGVLILLGIVLSLLISSVQLIPTIEAYIQSPRGTMDALFLFREHLAPLTHLITLIAPDFWGNPGTYNYFGGNGFYFEKMIFMGIFPLVFTIYGLMLRRIRHLHFWKIFGIISFSMGFALPTSWLIYIFHIPILASSYPTRIFSLSLFSFMTIAAYGMDTFLEKPNRSQMRYTLGFMSLCFIIIWLFIAAVWTVMTKYDVISQICMHPSWIGIFCTDFSVYRMQADNILYATVSLRNMILPTFFFIGTCVSIFSIRFSKRLFYLLAFGSILISSYYFSHKYTYFSERRFVYPDTPIFQRLKDLAGYDRVWGYGNAFIEKNIPQYFRMFSTDGYGYLSPKWYGELLSTIQSEGKLSTDMRRSDTDLFESSEKEVLGKGNPFRLRLMSLLGVKYILETKKGLDKDHKLLEERFPDTLFDLVFEDDTWRIWKYKQTLPRSFFSAHVEVVADDQKILDKMYDPATDLRHTVFVKSGAALEKKIEEDGVVDIVVYESSRVVLSVDAPEAGIVFLSDTYYPGWQVTVDGKKSEILKADYAFRSVRVDAGKHRVEFSYRPMSVMLGLAFTAIGLIGFVIVVYYIKK